MTRPRRPIGLTLVAAPQPDRTDLDMEPNAHSGHSNAEPHAETGVASQPREAFTVDPARDPRDVWMSAADVQDYLGRGRSQGYAFTGTPTFKSIAALPGRWRLSDVRAFFDAKAVAALSAVAWLPVEHESHEAHNAPDASIAAQSTPVRARRSTASTELNYPFLDTKRRSPKPGATRKERTT